MLSEGFPSEGCCTVVSLPHGLPRRVMITSSPSSRASEYLADPGLELSYAICGHVITFR